MRHPLPVDSSSIAPALARVARQVRERLAIALRDPRRVNPIYVFAGGLTVVVPIWLLFLNH